MFLDIENFSRNFDKHGGSDSDTQLRLVGVDRMHDSWYFDIVRFFGDSGIDPTRVSIQRKLTRFVQADPTIASFSDKIEKTLRSEGRIYDGPDVVRVTHADWSPGSASLAIQPIRYSDQVACFAMDFPDPLFDRFGGTLREYLRLRYPLLRLEDWPLGTSIGVCGHLILSEGNHRYLLRTRRSARVASLENSVGASVAGSVEFSVPYRDLSEMILESLSREVEEELGLETGEFAVTPLASAREMVRGNRPQLFAFVTTRLDREQVAARISSLPESRREHSEFRFIPLPGGRLGESERATFDFEGKMCYYLLEEWLAPR